MSAADHLIRDRFTAFHATVNESWPPAGDMVHVGSKAAATQRMGDFDDAYFETDLAGTSLDEARWKVHTISVRGRTYPHVLTDDQANGIAAYTPAALREDDLPSGMGYQVFAYRNHHEDKGALSYLVHPSAIHVSHTEHTGRPVRRRT
ncbi:MAG: hypothetical protein ACOH1Y_16915 [Propionicimonas sp.]